MEVKLLTADNFCHVSRNETNVRKSNEGSNCALDPHDFSTHLGGMRESPMMEDLFGNVALRGVGIGGFPETVSGMEIHLGRINLGTEDSQEKPELESGRFSTEEDIGQFLGSLGFQIINVHDDVFIIQ